LSSVGRVPAEHDLVLVVDRPLRSIGRALATLMDDENVRRLRYGSDIHVDVLAVGALVAVEVAIARPHHGLSGGAVGVPPGPNRPDWILDDDAQPDDLAHEQLGLVLAIAQRRLEQRGKRHERFIHPAPERAEQLYEV